MHTFVFLILVATFAVQDNTNIMKSISNDLLKTRKGRQIGESPKARLWLRYGLSCGDLPLFITPNKIFFMQDKKSNAMAVAHLKVSYKPTKQRIKIMNTEQAYKVFASVWDKNLLHIQEQFYVLFLNAANEVLCWRCFGTGTAEKCLIDSKLIAATAFTSLAQRVIVAHNHPSGLLRASEADIQLTWKLQALLRVLDIKLLDHLIIGDNDFVSMNEHNVVYFDKEPFGASA